MKNNLEYIGPYVLEQRPGVFALGSDSEALGGFAQVRRKEKVFDLGCGSGVLGLYLLAREPSIRLTAMDFSEAAVALAQDNFARNALEVQVVRGDLRCDAKQFPAGSFDLAVSNPPYFAAGSGYSGGPERMEETCTLEEVCAAAGWLVRNGGRFAIVHRPERLAELFEALRENRFEPKRMQFIHGRVDLPPSAVLVEAYKEGKSGVSILPPMVR